MAVDVEVEHLDIDFDENLIQIGTKFSDKLSIGYDEVDKLTKGLSISIGDSCVDVSGVEKIKMESVFNDLIFYDIEYNPRTVEFDFLELEKEKE